MNPDEHPVGPDSWLSESVVTEIRTYMNASQPDSVLEIARSGGAPHATSAELATFTVDHLVIVARLPGGESQTLTLDWPNRLEGRPDVRNALQELLFS